MKKTCKIMVLWSLIEAIYYGICAFVEKQFPVKLFKVFMGENAQKEKEEFEKINNKNAKIQCVTILGSAAALFAIGIVGSKKIMKED